MLNQAQLVFFYQQGAEISYICEQIENSELFIEIKIMILLNI